VNKCTYSNTYQPQPIHHHKQIEERGAKLRDLDVRGTSTAAIMAREMLHPVCTVFLVG
jgi:hypothetical protein